MEPRLRNPEHLQSIDAIRELMRRQFPRAEPTNGLVVEDLDVVLRVYGPDNATDAGGRYAFCEFKQGTAPLSRGQVNTFRQIDQDIRAGGSPRYFGFWLVNYTWQAFHGDAQLDRFEPRCVMFSTAYRLFCNQVEVVGHDAVCLLLSALVLPVQPAPRCLTNTDW